MKTEATQNKTVDIRYLNEEYEGSKLAEFTGKGKVRFNEGSFLFEGRKMLPIWLDIVLLPIVPLVYSNTLAWAGFGDIIAYGSALFPWIIIVAFVRLKTSVYIKDDSVKTVVEDKSKQRFLLLADIGIVGHRNKPICIAWQTTSDAASISTEFKSAFLP